ncbi:hypothetical protein ACLOJK_041884 [Asimina triloba]
MEPKGSSLKLGRSVGSDTSQLDENANLCLAKLVDSPKSGGTKPRNREVLLPPNWAPQSDGAACLEKNCEALDSQVQVWSENRLHFSRQEPAVKDPRLGDNLSFPHRVIENYWLPSFSTNAIAKDMMSDESQSIAYVVPNNSELEKGKPLEPVEIADRQITGTVEGGVCKLFGINLVENLTEPSLLPYAATYQPALHLLLRVANTELSLLLPSENIT